MTGPTDPPPVPNLPPTGTVSTVQIRRRQEAPDRVELVLHGELDLTTFPVARHKVGAALHESPAVLVLNMAELRYVDSSGIRLVLLAQQDADASGRKVAVRLGSGHARRLFDMLGLTERFDVLDVRPGIDADTDTDTGHPPDGTAGDRRQGWSP
jgi:anti-anti-sigma factor